MNEQGLLVNEREIFLGWIALRISLKNLMS